MKPLMEHPETAVRIAAAQVLIAAGEGEKLWSAVREGPV